MAHPTHTRTGLSASSQLPPRAPAPSSAASRPPVGAWPFAAALIDASTSDTLAGEICGAVVVSPREVLSRGALRHPRRVRASPRRRALDIVAGRLRLPRRLRVAVRVVHVRIHPGFNPAPWPRSRAAPLAHAVAGSAPLDDGSAAIVGSTARPRLGLDDAVRSRGVPGRAAPDRHRRRARRRLQPSTARATTPRDALRGRAPGWPGHVPGRFRRPAGRRRSGQRRRDRLHELRRHVRTARSAGRLRTRGSRRRLAGGGRSNERRAYGAPAAAQGDSQRRSADRQAPARPRAQTALTRRPATQVSRTSAAEPQNSTAAARCSRRDAADLGWSRSSATRSAGAPGAMPGGASPRLRAPLSQRHPQSAGAGPSSPGHQHVAAAASRRASPRSRAPPRTGRGARSSRSRTRPAPPRCHSSAAGRKPSPRLASVVGQAQTVAPRLRRAGRARRARVGRVDDGRRAPEQAAVVEQLDRPQAVLGERLLDLARLLAGVDVHRQPVPRGVAGDRLEPVARHRPHRVRRVADRHQRVAGDLRGERLDPRQVGLDAPVAEAALARRSAGGPRRPARRPRAAARCARRPPAPPSTTASASAFGSS